MISSPDYQSVANDAQKACAHKMILHQPEGYDTMLGVGVHNYPAVKCDGLVWPARFTATQLI